MKFSVNWLREIVELPTDVDELAELLTFAGVEIEGIERRGLDLEHVVVAQINASAQHPNADRLSVCEVDDGTNHKRQIVCGAKNYKVGDKVPVALPGAALPNGLKIKVSKLRGVESQGMLCSPIELAISEESDGLLILSPEAKVGAPIGSLFPPDAILDVEITPNRSDLLSYVGLAREIAALRGASFQLARIEGGHSESVRDEKRVRIAATRECPFFSARRIENVTVRPSPDWLRAKLESAGIRPINNLVDIGNFVMLELGQPLHIFDADKLVGGINVRLAEQGEKFLALDGKTYSLGPEMLMVTDAARAVGIAGVMGGEETGVTDATRNVLLESAWFLPSSVRRTARTLNLPSDASYHFERGVDPGMTLAASARAAQLMAELAGGQAAAETAVAGELPAAPANVTLRYNRCDQLLGITVPRATIEAALAGLGLQLADKSDAASTWKIPSYRADLKREVDLIEEVVRVYGIERIPAANRSTFMPVSAADRRHDRELTLASILCAFGFNEVRSSKLLPRETVAFAENAIQLRNPLSEEHVALRPSLIPGLLEVAARNFRNGAERVAIFEIGKAFVPTETREPIRIAMLFAGRPTGCTDKAELFDFRDLKGVIEHIAQSEGGVADRLRFERTSHPHLALATEIRWDHRVIGIAGQLSARLTERLDSTMPVLIAEMFAEPMEALLEKAKTFRDIGKYPSITRDISMVVPNSVTHADVLAAIDLIQHELLRKVEFFDEFVGQEAEKRFGAGRKSLAYTLTYREQNRTLTNDEVNVVHTRIRERLKSELGAELRE